MRSEIEGLRSLVTLSINICVIVPFLLYWLLRCFEFSNFPAHVKPDPDDEGKVKHDKRSINFGQ